MASAPGANMPSIYWQEIVHPAVLQISGSIGKIEQLFEDEGFQSQKLAALVASKVGQGISGVHTCS